MNKFRNSIGTIWLASFCMAVGSEVEVVELDLNAALLQGLQSNFQIRIEKVEPEIAESELRGFKGQYDPRLEARYDYRLTEGTTLGADDELAQLSVGVAGELPFGTQYFLGSEMSDGNFAMGSDFFNFNSGVNTYTGVTVTQPLLRSFGLNNPRQSRVKIARQGVRFSESAFQERVNRILTELIGVYYDFYFAQENLRISIENRDLALRLLEDNRERVRSGVLAPLDVVQAESESALREVSVISAEADMKRQENRLKGLLYSGDRHLQAVRLVIEPPPVPMEIQADLGTDIQMAIHRRPDLRQQDLALEIREQELRQAKRNALPQVDLVATYGRLGYDAERLRPSFRDSLDDGKESYSVGAVVSIPFPNRALDAERTTAFLRRNQELLRLNALEQTIRLQVEDAIIQMEADWKAMEASRRARALAERALQAEEKKLEAGTSSSFFVLRLQGDLALAEIREMVALSNYAKSVAEYDYVRGYTLERWGIESE